MRTLFIFITVLFFCRVLAAQNNIKPLKITPLCKDAFVFTTYNEFKGSLFPANGMYVLSDSGVVMIDTPWDTLQFQPLLDSIEKRHQKKVVLCISTHYHDDRTGGLEYYRQKGIKTFTSKQTLELCRQYNEKQAEFYFTKDTVFTVGGKSFKTLYPGEGHTKDNIVVWAGDEKILYGGCFVKSTESKDLGNLKDANPKEWEKSMMKVIKQFPKPAYVIPGHFNWSNTTSLKHTLNMVRKHLKKKPAVQVGVK